MLLHPLHIWWPFAATHIPPLLLLTTAGTEPKNLTTCPPLLQVHWVIFCESKAEVLFLDSGSGRIFSSLQAKCRSVRRVTPSLCLAAQAFYICQLEYQPAEDHMQLMENIEAQLQFTQL